MPLRGPGWCLISLVLLLSACNSEQPEPADVEVPTAGIRVSLTRIATHPFLARYRLILGVEGPGRVFRQGRVIPRYGLCRTSEPLSTGIRWHHRVGSVRRTGD